MLIIQGITMDMRNCQNFQYAHFRDMVMNFGGGADANAIFVYNKFGPRRDSRIVARDMLKRYLPVLQKGIVSDELNVFPFGYE
jgi:hypothetical protein